MVAHLGVEPVSLAYETNEITVSLNVQYKRVSI
nr:MAG TPA: hypothetical protein [Caudoviricetes sp.]